MRRRAPVPTPHVLMAAMALIAAVASTGATVAEPAYERTSAYVPVARDGVRLAVDVYLPKQRQPGAKIPALLELTRYWRGYENPETGEPVALSQSLDLFFLSHGYALVKVDVRGSGASFGTRPTEYGPEEVRDGYDVVEWVVAQRWSNGKVGAYGTSYTGTTAELLAASGHPAVRAVIPGWSDFDVYASPVRPYGLVAAGFIKEWSDYVALLDKNDPAVGGRVRRVDADADGSLRAAAVREHAANPDVYKMVTAAPFRDQKTGPGRLALADSSVMRWRKEIEASGVPMLVLASWLDAGTAAGALQRLQHFSNPQKVVILASMHGGGAHASPYTVSDKPLASVPSAEVQAQMRLDFFNHHLEGEDNGADRWPAVRYFNMGEEAQRETDVWPPAGRRARRYYLAGGGGLASGPPTSEDGEDTYRVDYGVSTGTANRWSTQMGRPVVRLDDRGAMDARMLTYTSPPLAADLQVTGTPVVSLTVTSDRDDGAVLVYLEDVDEKGRSRYLTEGGLRPVHRKLSSNPYFEQQTPYHSFAQADALPVVPGKPVELVFELMPTSVLIRQGHRLRLAIAGADADTFERVPDEGESTLRVARRRGAASFVDLPVIEAAP